MERLTSRENALIKEYRKLCGSRKRREEPGCFVLEGARLVLDAANGGSGMVCDWSLAARVAAARPVMLAGGLNAGNIAEAVKSVNPFGVDLSSGVESGKKGIKSHIKLKEIFNILREIR